MCDATANPRYLMWKSLIPGYAKMTSGMKSKAKIKYATERNTVPSMINELKMNASGPVFTAGCIVDSGYSPNFAVCDTSYTHSISDYSSGDTVTATLIDNCINMTKMVGLADLNPCPVRKTGCSKEEKEKDNTMYAANRYTNDETKRYLLARVDEITYAKHAEAKVMFGLTDDDAPMTAKDLVERIQAGKFVAPSKERDKDTYGDVYVAVGRLRWRDPAKVEDNDGFKAFEKLFAQAKQKTEDQILVKDAEKALDEVIALEAFAIQ